MEWMDGKHLSEYAKEVNTQEHLNQLGQALWDFYQFQFHQMREVHADPHPGNFLINENHQLIALDFGCLKQIPEEFYTPYFELVRPEILNNETEYITRMRKLEIIRPDDTPEEIKLIADFFHELLSLFTQPFRQETFDFSDATFFAQIANLGEQVMKNDTLKKLNGNRGSKHFLYINRTFFGLYNLLFDLKAKIVTGY
jgi:predicted unusual protein kinase regulating ubiquinone biosynthesis (AarF/ABC1/UbiB family)